MSSNEFELPEAGIQYLYKSVDEVDFELIYAAEPSDKDLNKKLRILNSTKTYSFDYTINHSDEFLEREGIIKDIPVELYVRAKDDDSMFYSLLINNFKTRQYFPDVEINTLHYSIDRVDYELCDLDKGNNSNPLFLL